MISGGERFGCNNQVAMLLGLLMMTALPGVNFPDGTRKLTTWLPSATLWVRNDNTNEKNWTALGGTPMLRQPNWLSR